MLQIGHARAKEGHLPDIQLAGPVSGENHLKVLELYASDVYRVTTVKRK